MGKRKCVLIESGALLTEGVGSLLQDQMHYQVISRLFGNRDEFIHAVQELQPDTIVLGESSGEQYLEEIIRKHDGTRELRVIVLHDKDNQVQVFHRRQITISTSSDLAKVI